MSAISGTSQPIVCDTFTWLPPELQAKILIRCFDRDKRSVGLTCRTFANLVFGSVTDSHATSILWGHKLEKLKARVNWGISQNPKTVPEVFHLLNAPVNLFRGCKQPQYGCFKDLDKIEFEVKKDFADADLDSRKKILERFKSQEEITAEMEPMLYGATMSDDERGQLAKQVFVLARSKDGSGLLHVAVGTGIIPVIKALLEAGVSIDQRRFWCGEHQETPLYRAVSVSLEVTKLLVEQYGADVNAKTSDGITVLMEAAVGEVEIVRYLHENGARLDERSKENACALCYATQKKGDNLEIIQYLLKHMDHPVAALIALLDGNKQREVEILLNAGIILDAKSINRPDSYGRTVLMAAAKNPNAAPLVERLLTNGAAETINAIDNKGATALLDARNAEIRQLLIKHGASANV